MYQHIFSGLLAAWLSLAPLWAQECPDKPISTDPDNLVSESGSIAVPNPFDWRIEYFPVNSEYQPPSATFIQSPFYHPNNGDLSHLVDSKDMQPEDGWELIAYKTGVNPDGTNQTTQAGFVYLVLYNKYTGIMRVMAAGDPEENHNGARIVTKFDAGQYVPSVYSHISEVQAVETFPLAARSAMSVMRYRGGNSKWFYADFPMAYDPCVCEYASSMKLEISLIDTAMVNLSGDITGTLADITDQTNGQVEEDGYSFQDLAGGAKQAQKSYKTVNAWKSAQLKALKMEGKTQAQLNEAEKQKKVELNALQEVLKSSTFLQKGLKAAPYIAGALELVKFFVAGASESSGPQEVKITPMALNANISLQGNIVSTYPFDDVIFYTPGSKNAHNESQAEWYPFYNEVLGTFNLMERPRVFFSQKDTGTTVTLSWIGIYHRSYKRYHFKLEEASVKPLLNPSADLEIVDIHAALVFRGLPHNHIDPLIQVPSIANSGVMIYPTKGLQTEAVYRTREIPIGCLEGVRADIAADKITEENIFLKIYLNLKRQDTDTNTQHVLLEMEFPVELVDKTSDASFDWSSPYSGYQANTILNSGSGSITDDVIAWETITIESSAAFQPGPNGIKIIAGEEIIVEPDADIPPGVELIIGDPTQCTQTIPLQTKSEIQTFCQSSTYQHPNRQMRLAIDSSRLPIQKNLSLTAHPNPFTQSLTLRYTLPKTAKVSLTLYDAVGRPVRTLQAREWVKAGPQEIVVPAEGLAAGLYHAVLQAGEARATVKVLKQ